MAPTRTCIGCRRTCSSDQLIRVARTEGGDLVLGPTHPGRGAWLCRDSPRCMEQAVKRKAFDRAFRSRVEDPQMEAIRTTLGSRSEAKAGPGSEGSVL